MRDSLEPPNCDGTAAAVVGVQDSAATRDSAANVRSLHTAQSHHSTAGDLGDDGRLGVFGGRLMRGRVAPSTSGGDGRAAVVAIAHEASAAVSNSSGARVWLHSSQSHHVTAGGDRGDSSVCAGTGRYLW